MNEDRFEEISEALKELQYESIIDVQLLKCYSQNAYGQCWTREAESDALWRIYAYEKSSVRIEIDQDDVEKLYHVQVHDVDYTDSINLKDEIRKTYFHLKPLSGSQISYKDIDEQYCEINKLPYEGKSKLYDKP